MIILFLKIYESGQHCTLAPFVARHLPFIAKPSNTIDNSILECQLAYPPNCQREPRELKAFNGRCHLSSSAVK